MKRPRDLFDRVASPEALLRAFYRARRGKRYRLEADRFFARLETEVMALSRHLRDGTYQPGAYRHFYIQEPKLRLVSAAPFRDRVVHHARRSEWVMRGGSRTSVVQRLSCTPVVAGLQTRRTCCWTATSPVR